MTRLGKYELHEELGRGGFGTVYRATDTVLGREVALKILHPQLAVDLDFIQHFQNEAKMIASLDHFNIVTIYDMGEESGRMFFAMKYLPGGSLRDKLQKEGRLTFEQALQITKEVSSALQTAHKEGFIHRDIKPENILFTKDRQAIISDFGLAKTLQSSSSYISSGLGSVGTPPYTAPEIWGGGQISPASDQYSLACVLYEMLTGEALFNGSTPPEIMTKHMLNGPHFPTNWPVGVPRGISKILGKALDKDPKKRYKNTLEFVSALDGLKGIKSPPPPIIIGWKTRVGNIKLPLKLHGIQWAGTAIVFIVFVALLAALTKSLPAPFLPVRTPSLTATTSLKATPGSTQTPSATYTPVLLSNSTPTSLGGGGRIAFVSNRDGNNEIYVMNADGSGVIKLTNNPAGNGDPAWSPDGRKIAFSSSRNGNTDINLMNSDGSGQTNLTNNPSVNYAPAWSPDGRKIAFLSNRDGNNEIYVMNADGSGVTNLTNNPAGDGDPAWSPDGKEIAFSSSRNGSFDIYVMNADGSAATRLTNNPFHDEFPSWSPDGKKIVFYSRCGKQGCEIYVMNTDGSGQINLTNEPVWGSSGPTSPWSPDGKKIAFVNFEIYVMNANGSGQTNLTNNPSVNYAPAWSPDGRKIAFISKGEITSDIYIMNADGNGQTNLTNNPASAFIWFLSWSPQ